MSKPAKETKAERDEKFMQIAFEQQYLSNDPSRRVGACVISKDGKEVIGRGYNHMPHKQDNLPIFTWVRMEKHFYVCHAELNAINDATKKGKQVKGCTVYTTLFPSNECAKLIVELEIKEVVYQTNDKRSSENYRTSREILHNTGVTFRPTANLDKRYMEIAQQQKNYCKPPVQVGACVFNEGNKMFKIGLGYSGMPNVILNDGNQSTEKHAVANAIINAKDDNRSNEDRAVENAIINAKDVNFAKDSTIYVTTFPCNKCLQLIQNAGILEVVYDSATKPEYYKKYQKAGIIFRKFDMDNGNESEEPEPETITCPVD